VTIEELAEYKAEVLHRKEVERLTRELADAVLSNATAAKAAAGKSDLESRYDLRPAKADVKEPEAALALPSAKPQRSPSRSQRV
jgi:hypothetical protein